MINDILNDTERVSIMNRTPSTQERLEARFAYKVAAGLQEAADKTPHDISERLKSARHQALAVRKKPAPQTQAAQSVNVSRSGSNASATLGGGPFSPDGWAYRLSYLLPALALAWGLWTVMQAPRAAAPATQNAEIAALADIDADVLADELPPVAYLESGFSAFAKNELGPNGTSVQ